VNEELGGKRSEVVGCPRCGAAIDAARATCWLCGAELGPAVAAPRAGAERTAAVAKLPPEFSYSLSTLLLITTLVAVAFGLLSVAPGLGIIVCILLVPVLVRTAMVVRRREAAGRPVSVGQKFGMILGSLVVAHVILAVVIVSAVGTFCAVCLGIAGTRGPDDAVIWFAILAAAFATILLLVLMFRWVRARYRRDIQ